DTTPNMTGSPIASGRTLPASLSIELAAIEPAFTVSPTSLGGDHNHGIINLDINVAVGLGEEVPLPTNDTTPTQAAFISPNPHQPEITADTDDIDGTSLLTPTPPTHAVVLPVTGITFSPTSAPYTPAGTIIADTAVEVDSDLSPNPHAHNTPRL